MPAQGGGGGLAAGCTTLPIQSNSRSWWHPGAISAVTSQRHVSYLCCRKPNVLAGGGLVIGFRLPKLVVYLFLGGERSGSRARTLLNGLACEP